ncbi:hypothetical protein ADK52_24435 [Streptomyces sp. WM6372]|uniref:hypothetical protein n=1 Tax=Streptomyces sp. WM6372 TaxID=1415555 RepID=UPI0006ADE16D|nr:hypothetical protein [Streptomyces sp. WM6372]KOU21270.1 hypothetical protein ADK52_24435 [Streptomyces sp. WM6372]
MPISMSTLRGTAVLAAALAALSVSCSTNPKESAPAPAASSAPAATPGAAGSAAPDAAAPASPTAASRTPSPQGSEPVSLVRDAFAGLQATLGESCTPGNCAYFLGRVHDELHRMDAAMKADPKGPGHFPEPIALIKKLDAELAGDRSFENLKKHQTTLIGTRDKINTWMQGHPDDYR